MKNASLSQGATRALLLSLALFGSASFAQESLPPSLYPLRAAASATTAALHPVDAAQTKILMDAIKSRNWDSARAAIAAGADVNAADRDGVTVLMRAADAIHIELVELLVQKGADVNAVDKKGQSALHYAIPADPKPKKKFGFGQVLGAMGGGLGVLAGATGLGGFASLLGGGGLESLLGGNLTSLLGGQAFNLGGKGNWSAIAGAALQGDAGGGFGISQLLGSGGLLGGSQMSALSADNWTSLLSSVKGANPEILGAMSNLGTGHNARQSALWGQFLNAASSGDQEGVAKMMQNPNLAPLLQQATAGLSAVASDLPGNASRSIIGALVKGGAKAETTNKNGKTAATLAQERGLTNLFSTN